MFRVLKIASVGITPGCINPNQAERLNISGYDSSSVLLMMPVMVFTGYRRITLDLKELGESCGPNRVLKIMMNNSIAAVRGYKKHKSYSRGCPQIVPPNHLNREFVVKTPDTLRNSVSQVTDIIYIRTWQGWLYLAVVLDLYSRKVIDWSMKPTLAKDIVLDALLMAVLRRRPNESVRFIHSLAQQCCSGSQYSSGDWQKFCQKYNLVPNMSHCGLAQYTAHGIMPLLNPFLVI